MGSRPVRSPGGGAPAAAAMSMEERVERGDEAGLRRAEGNCRDKNESRGWWKRGGSGLEQNGENKEVKKETTSENFSREREPEGRRQKPGRKQKGRPPQHKWTRRGRSAPPFSAAGHGWEGALISARPDATRKRRLTRVLPRSPMRRPSHARNAAESAEQHAVFFSARKDRSRRADGGASDGSVPEHGPQELRGSS